MKRILALTAVLILFCSTALAYVGNRNTRKFHHDSCSSVSQMKPSNRVYIETRLRPLPTVQAVKILCYRNISFFYCVLASKVIYCNVQNVVFIVDQLIGKEAYKLWQAKLLDYFEHYLAFY